MGVLIHYHCFSGLSHTDLCPMDASHNFIRPLDCDTLLLNLFRVILGDYQLP
jgi:hypothetical protein